MWFDQPEKKLDLPQIIIIEKKKKKITGYKGCERRSWEILLFKIDIF